MKSNFYQKGISEIIIVIIIGAVLAAGMFLFFRMKFPPTEMPEITKEVKESIKEEESKKEEVEIFSEDIYKDETTNWNVYINEEYGYEIKYPKDWTYTESERRKIFVGFLPPETEEEEIITESGLAIYYKGDITIFVSSNRDEKSIEDFYVDYFSWAKGGHSEVKVDDKLGVRFKDVEWLTEIRVDIVVIPFDTVEFGSTFLEFTGSQIKISDNLETFEKMLSTFKSIEEETAEKEPVPKETPPEASGCVDTDGGENIYEKGTLLNVYLTTGKNPTDYCLDYSPGTLVEYSCEYNMEEGYLGGIVKGIYSASIKCPKGCEDDACIK